jgi:TetR/AcrR family transcriptional repressor of lmrAB and yxaGH operons
MTTLIVNKHRVGSDTKQKMIERTAVLLAKKGLQATSFSEVLEASGAPRGSLYHYFPDGKEELVLAAIGLAGDRALALLDQLRGAPADKVGTAFLAMWRSVLERSDFGAGCAVAAVTVAADSPDLIREASRIFREWRHRLADLFVVGGIAPKRAAAVAATLISASEGAVILARAEHSFEPFDLVAQEEIRRIRGAMASR